MGTVIALLFIAFVFNAVGGPNGMFGGGKIVAFLLVIAAAIVGYQTAKDYSSSVFTDEEAKIEAKKPQQSDIMYKDNPYIKKEKQQENNNK